MSGGRLWKNWRHCHVHMVSVLLMNDCWSRCKPDWLTVYVCGGWFFVNGLNLKKNCFWNHRFCVRKLRAMRRGVGINRLLQRSFGVRRLHRCSKTSLIPNLFSRGAISWLTYAIPRKIKQTKDRTKREAFLVPDGQEN